MENIFDGNLTCFILRQLMAPCHSLVGSGAFTRILILGVSGSLLPLWFPSVPALGSDCGRQFTMHEERVAVVAPGTPEVQFGDIRGRCHLAAIEHVTKGLVLWCRSRCDIAVSFAMDVALLKPSRRRAEDEVGSAFDVAMVEIVTTACIASIDSVLMAKETAVYKKESVALGMQCNGLSQSGRVVLDSDVL